MIDLTLRVVEVRGAAYEEGAKRTERVVATGRTSDDRLELSLRPDEFGMYEPGDLMRVRLTKKRD